MSELLHRMLKQVISYNNRFDINNLFFKSGILGHNDITEEVGVNLKCLVSMFMKYQMICNVDSCPIMCIN